MDEVERLERQHVFQGRVVDLSVDRVRLPNGNVCDLELIRHPGAAAVVPVDAGGDVILVRQYRYAAGGWLVEVPAGKLDGDTPEACAAKELEEEAGRRPGRLERLGSIWTTPGFTDEVIHLFAAFDLTPVPTRLESHEVIEVVPTPLGRALEMVWSGEITDAKSAVALVHAARRIGMLR